MTDTERSRQDPAETRPSKPASPPVSPGTPDYEAPPKDTEFQGHPEFSQDAAKNKPPQGLGLAERRHERKRGE